MNKLQYALAALIIAGFIILTVVLFIPAVQTEMPQWVKENLTAVFVAWITQFSTVVNYFFGSSKGSADKNNLINK